MNHPTGTPTSIPTAFPTQAVIIRIGANRWIWNSAVGDGSINQLQLGYANLALGIAVILHSFYLNTLKKQSESASRVLVYMCAAGCILAGILVIIQDDLISRGYDEQTMTAYLTDLGNNGIAAIMTQIPDDFIFLLGYIYIHKRLSRMMQIIVSTYMVIALYCSYVPMYTFLPFILNTNSDEFQQRYVQPGMYIYTLGEILYGLYMSRDFLLAVYEANISRTRRVIKKHQIFALSCCCHCLSSITAVSILAANYTTQGLLTYNLHICTSLHLLFNVQVLDWVLRSQTFENGMKAMRRRYMIRAKSRISQQAVAVKDASEY